MTQIEELTQLLQQASTGIAFTGAGISTESGIPDFRSPGGVWSRHKPVYYDDFMSDRAERVRYWQMRREVYKDFRNAEPNAGHAAIARLEELGRIRAVVTQNIDGLHQLGGSARVLELHGTNRIAACMSCGKEWQPDEVLARLDVGEDAPDCDDCGGPIKSKTVSFGQPMPAALMQEAAQLARQADIFLAIGSSLVVEPAASLPRLACHAGASLVIINRDPTPLDPLATLIIREPIGVTLTAALRGCDPSWRPCVAGDP